MSMALVLATNASANSNEFLSLDSSIAQDDIPSVESPRSAAANEITSAAARTDGLFGRTVNHIKNIPTSVFSLLTRVLSSIASLPGALYNMLSSIGSLFSRSSARNDDQSTTVVADLNAEAEESNTTTAMDQEANRKDSDSDDSGIHINTVPAESSTAVGVTSDSETEEDN